MSKLIDPLADAINIALRVNMTQGQRKALGVANRATSDQDIAALAQRVADNLRRSGWRFEHQPANHRPHSTP